MNMMNPYTDLSSEIPVTEPERQYYYIEKARKQLQKKMEEAGRPLTFCVTTFGCQMNARDSEKLVGILEQIGYVEETNEEKADFVIYNTCTVRENANLRVYGRLGQLNRVKKKNPHMMIGLCGCMMQEPKVIEKLKKRSEEVDKSKDEKVYVLVNHGGRNGSLRFLYIGEHITDPQPPFAVDLMIRTETDIIATEGNRELKTTRKGKYISIPVVMNSTWKFIKVKSKK